MDDKLFQDLCYRCIGGIIGIVFAQGIRKFIEYRERKRERLQRITDKLLGRKNIDDAMADFEKFIEEKGFKPTSFIVKKNGKI